MNNSWTQIGNDIDGKAADDWSGEAIDGNNFYAIFVNVALEKYDSVVYVFGKRKSNENDWKIERRLIFATGKEKFVEEYIIGEAGCGYIEFWDVIKEKKKIFHFLLKYLMIQQKLLHMLKFLVDMDCC